MTQQSFWTINFFFEGLSARTVGAKPNAEHYAHRPAQRQRNILNLGDAFNKVETFTVKLFYNFIIILFYKATKVILFYKATKVFEVGAMPNTERPAHFSRQPI